MQQFGQEASCRCTKARSPLGRARSRLDMAQNLDAARERRSGRRLWVRAVDCGSRLPLLDTVALVLALALILLIMSGVDCWRLWHHDGCLRTGMKKTLLLPSRADGGRHDVRRRCTEDGESRRTRRRLFASRAPEDRARLASCVYTRAIIRTGGSWLSNGSPCAAQVQDHRLSEVRAPFNVFEVRKRDRTKLYVHHVLITDSNLSLSPRKCYIVAPCPEAIAQRYYTSRGVRTRRANVRAAHGGGVLGFRERIPHSRLNAYLWKESARPMSAVNNGLAGSRDGGTRIRAPCFDQAGMFPHPLELARRPRCVGNVHRVRGRGHRGTKNNPARVVGSVLNERRTIAFSSSRPSEHGHVHSFYAVHQKCELN
ncbi:hypothetical protein GY45DRAFT_565241 [Cubamyces sp. BRFM 1775]|nr:hypothetical protein GY45DRAFT_565241 [Cubamyces sp. BRFM 1775]